MLPPKLNGFITRNWGCGEAGKRELRAASSPPLYSFSRSINVPLLVLRVLAADDVHVALALPPHALSFPSACQFLSLVLRPSAVCRPGGPVDGARTLHPSHSFLTLLRTFIPRTCCWRSAVAVVVSAGRAGERHCERARVGVCVVAEARRGTAAGAARRVRRNGMRRVRASMVVENWRRGGVVVVAGRGVR